MPLLLLLLLLTRRRERCCQAVMYQFRDYSYNRIAPMAAKRYPPADGRFSIFPVIRRY